METGGDARRLHLGKHVPQCLLVLGILRTEIIVAAKRPGPLRLDNIRVVECHELEPAGLHVRQQLVNVLRRDNARSMEDRPIDAGRTAALHAARQTEVRLQRIHRVKERLASGRRDERSPSATQLLSAHKIGRQQPVSAAVFMVNIGIRRSAHHADGNRLVPAGIQPVAKVLPVGNRQLQHAERRDGRNIHLEVLIGRLAVTDEIDQLECHVRRRHLHTHLRLVHPVREARNQHISVKPKRTGGIGRALVGMDELDLVVERTILRRREHRQSDVARQTLLTRRLHDQRTHHRIRTDLKPERRVLQHNHACLCFADRKRKQHNGKSANCSHARKPLDPAQRMTTVVPCGTFSTVRVMASPSTVLPKTS